MEEVKNKKINKIWVLILCGIVIILILFFILWLIKWFVYKICVFDIIGHVAICAMIYFSLKFIVKSVLFSGSSIIVNRVITYSIGLYYTFI
jgi:hypothetical protein